MVNKVENNKIRNESLFRARKKINENSDKTCLLCGKKVSSFCHSHSIPISVFDKMNLNNNRLYSHETICQSEVITNLFSGKKNSSIFKNICIDCDRDFFWNLDNMNVLNIKWSDVELRLQAIRILLYEIYRTQEFSLSFFCNIKDYIDEEELNFNASADAEKICALKNEFYSLLNDTSRKFQVIYEKILDYQVGFCCATLLCINLTPVLHTIIIEGKSEKLEITSEVIDSEFKTVMKLSKNDKFGNFVYLVILPVEGYTKILLYSNEKSIAGIALMIEFQELSEEEKMEKLSAILSNAGNNMYGNEEFFNKFTKYKEYCQFVKGKRKDTSHFGLRIKDEITLYQIMEQQKYNLFK